MALGTSEVPSSCKKDDRTLKGAKGCSRASHPRAPHGGRGSMRELPPPSGRCCFKALGW